MLLIAIYYKISKQRILIAELALKLRELLFNSIRKYKYIYKKVAIYDKNEINQLESSDYYLQ